MKNLKTELKALNDKCYENKLELIEKVFNTQKDKLFGQLSYFVNETLTNKSFPFNLDKCDVEIEELDVDEDGLSDVVYSTAIEGDVSAYIYIYCTLRGVAVTIGVYVNVTEGMELKQGDWQASCPDNNLDGGFIQGNFTQGNFTQDLLNMLEKEVAEIQI